jgi:hypothetical protein
MRYYVDPAWSARTAQATFARLRQMRETRAVREMLRVIADARRT